MCPDSPDPKNEDLLSLDRLEELHLQRDNQNKQENLSEVSVDSHFSRLQEKLKLEAAQQLLTANAQSAQQDDLEHNPPLTILDRILDFLASMLTRLEVLLFGTKLRKYKKKQRSRKPER